MWHELRDKVNNKHPQKPAEAASATLKQQLLYIKGRADGSSFFLSKGSVPVRYCSGAQTFVTHLNSSLFHIVDHIAAAPPRLTLSIAQGSLPFHKPRKNKGNSGKSHNMETVQKCHPEKKTIETLSLSLSFHFSLASM